MVAMSSTACPFCGARVSPEATPTGVCPGCRQQVFIPLRLPPSSSTQVPVVGGKASGVVSPRKLRWGAVRFGLDVLSMGVVFFVFLVLGRFAHDKWLGAGPIILWKFDSWQLELWQLEAGGAALAGAIALIGALFCCGVPKASKARPWSRAFLLSVLAVASAGGALAYLTRAQPPGPDWRAETPWLAPSLAGVGVAFALAAPAFFFLLLRRLSRFLGDADHGRNVMDYFTLFWVIPGVAAGCVALWFIARKVWFGDQLPWPSDDQVQTLRSVAGWMGPPLLIVSLVWLLTLLRRLRRLMPHPTP
jgi:hypothetical protein